MITFDSNEAWQVSGGTAVVNANDEKEALEIFHSQSFDYSKPINVDIIDCSSKPKGVVYLSDVTVE